MMRRIAARMRLFLEAEEAAMPGLVRAEAGDFDVVAKDVRVFGFGVVFAGEEFLLVIEAGAPGEIRADFQIFALAMAGHVGSMDAFGGLGVVRTAGGMDV